MRVIALTEPGSSPGVLELDTPEPEEGEVRVRVRAASVNGFDLAVASGMIANLMEHRYPVVLGKDFAGVVDAVGDGVDDYVVGDRVFGVVTKAFVRDGSFGDYVTVPTSLGLAHLPDGIDFPEAAALGLAGSAAVGVLDQAALQPGQTVLVAGATGGVGNQAVQLAARAGAHVIATAATPEERAAVTSLGADEIIDYTGDVEAAVRSAHPEGVDVVCHFAGDPGVLLGLVRDGGRFVSLLVFDPSQFQSDTATVHAVYANPTQELLDRLAENQRDGVTRVTVQRTYSFEEIPNALTDFAGGTVGKLVITMP